MDTPHPEATLRTLFIATAATHPEDIGVRWSLPDGTAFALAHSERLARARVIAELASGLDVRAGSRVALFLPVVPAWLDLFLGFAATGSAVVALPPTLPANDAIHVLRETGADVLFAGSEQIDEARAISTGLPGLRIVAHADVPYPSAPHEPEAATERFPDYRRLFSSAVEKAFANGAAFDRSEPSPGDVALVATNREFTHADILDMGKTFLAEFHESSRSREDLDGIHIVPGASFDALSMITRAISLPLLAAVEGDFPPCVIFDERKDA